MARSGTGHRCYGRHLQQVKGSCGVLHNMMGRWMKRSVTSSLKPGRVRRASIARNRGSCTTCTLRSTRLWFRGLTWTALGSYGTPAACPDTPHHQGVASTPRSFVPLAKIREFYFACMLPQRRSPCHTCRARRWSYRTQCARQFTAMKVTFGLSGPAHKPPWASRELCNKSVAVLHCAESRSAHRVHLAGL
jgi:hypothetical protein